VDGLTCAVDVGVETVLVCFCCSGVEVGDGPGPVDGVGVKSNSVTPRGSVRRDRAMTVPMWWTSRRWARASRVVDSSFVMMCFLSKAPARARTDRLGETATVFVACWAIEVG